MARVVWDRNWQRTLDTAMAPKLLAAGHLAADRQRARIPVSTDGSHGRRPGYARDSITVRRGRDPAGSYVDAGPTATTPDGYPYPLGLELGTPPHIIRSTGPWPLRNRATGQVFGPVVRHPGTPAYGWCAKAVADLNGRRI